MPLQYHNDSEENLYAIKRLGQTFSDAVINMAEAQSKARQFQQQNQIAQQYLGLAAQKQAVELPEISARTENTREETNKLREENDIARQTAQQGEKFGQAGAWANMSPEDLTPLLNDPKIGPQINAYLQQQNVMPGNQSVMHDPRLGTMFGNAAGGDPQAVQRKLRAAMMAYAFKVAGRNPAEAAQFLEPKQFTPGSMMGGGVIRGNDPSQMQQVPFGQPRPPTMYESGRLQQGEDQRTEANRHNLEMEKIGAGREEKMKDSSEGSELSKLLQGGGQQGGKPIKVSSQEEYDALPNGAQFIDDSGQTKIKGKK